MKLQTFGRMTPDQQREAVAGLAAVAKGAPNGQMGPINAKLAAFEARYEMTTARMIAAFKSGQIPDTADIAEWLVIAKARG